MTRAQAELAIEHNVRPENPVRKVRLDRLIYDSLSNHYLSIWRQLPSILSRGSVQRNERSHQPLGDTDDIDAIYKACHGNDFSLYPLVFHIKTQATVNKLYIFCTASHRNTNYSTKVDCPSTQCSGFALGIALPIRDILDVSFFLSDNTRGRPCV